MTDANQHARMDDLETRLTFIDDTVTELSAADAEQSLRLRALEQAVADMRDELRLMRTALGHDGHGEPPPPHY